MLGSPILYLMGMRIMMFQLSGLYCSFIRAGTRSPTKTPQSESLILGELRQSCPDLLQDRLEEA